MFQFITVYYGYYALVFIQKNALRNAYYSCVDFIFVGTRGGLELEVILKFCGSVQKKTYQMKILYYRMMALAWYETFDINVCAVFQTHKRKTAKQFSGFNKTAGFKKLDGR